MRLHDLRRTSASWMTMNSNNGYIIGKALNHTDSKATDIYARLNNEPVRNTMTKIVDQFENIRNGCTEHYATPFVLKNCLKSIRQYFKDTKLQIMILTMCLISAIKHYYQRDM